MEDKKTMLPLKDDRIRIGAYSPILHPTEEHIQMLAEAGIDFAVIYLGNIPEDKQADVFRWLEQTGIECTVRMPSIDKQYKRAHMLDFEKVDGMFFRDSPAFAAYTYVDEPGIEHFEELGKEVEEFKRRFPGKRAYINLLPMYANSAQFMGGAWKSPIEYYETPDADFETYLREYVKHVNTDYLCTDIYPCRRAPKKECPENFPAEYEITTYGDYVRCTEIAADVCRESGRNFWVCIQTCSWSKNVREPSGAELRWQAYTMLSFGAKTLLYYVYDGARPNHTGCVVNARGEKTELFLASRRLTQGLKRLSDTYVTYRNLGAYHVNCTEATPYLTMRSPYTGFDTIAETEADTPLLIGCFEKKEGAGKAFTVVNMRDFAAPGDAHVRMKITGKSVTLWRDGVPEAWEAEDGWYTLTLEQGDGVFVTVD